jgi:tight adherence protein B
LANPGAVLDALRQDRGFGDFDNAILAWLNDFLTQTGLTIERNLLAIWTFALSGVFLLVFSTALGFSPLSLLLAVLAGVLVVFVFLRRKRRQRIERFSHQLPDALDIIVRGVRVGHPFSAALGLVAKEMPDPIGTEFGMTADEIAFGLDLRRAIGNLYRRVGQEDLLFLIVSVNVQSQTGGSLAEILTKLSRLIRNRMKVRLKIKSLTADGRLSAIVLSLVPFVLFGLINLVTPSYYGAVRDHPAFFPAIVVGLVLLAIGNLIMYRMVNFKY